MLAWACLSISLTNAFCQASTNNVPDSTNSPALAMVIVYDGSGSMADKVKGANRQLTPKHVIGNNALIAVADKLQEFTETKKTNILAGLVTFRGGKVQTAIPIEVFKADRFKTWAKESKAPNGGTPLGDAIREASKLLKSTNLPIKKHILVITDGENNIGSSPEAVLAEFKQNNDSISVYFVAFDVAAKVFAPVKNLGATVVSASDEIGLRVQLDSIVGKKILLEAE
jgi:uncharacterized protein YegL